MLNCLDRSWSTSIIDGISFDPFPKLHSRRVERASTVNAGGPALNRRHQNAPIGTIVTRRRVMCQQWRTADRIGAVGALVQTHLLHRVSGSYSFPAGCDFENGLVTRFLSTGAELKSGSAWA